MTDGKHHPVDSKEVAFITAGKKAFVDAVQKAKPVLLEPIMHVDVFVPDEYMGDIMGDLSSRRGKPQGMEAQGHNQIIKAQVPMAEFLTYAPDLRSITGGRGMFTMEFSHYEAVPHSIAVSPHPRQ